MLAAAQGIAEFAASRFGTRVQFTKIAENMIDDPAGILKYNVP